MVWGTLFYHAVIVHILCGLSSLALILIVRLSSMDTLDVWLLFTKGLVPYAKESPATVTIFSTWYVACMLFWSIVSGVADLPSKLTRVVGWVAEQVRLAPEPVEDEPIWYQALGLERRRSSDSRVQVKVVLKNGDVYIGQLLSYPILPDSEKSKDFRLGDSYYLPGGDVDEQVELSFSKNESGGGVLLNTVNVSSIEYIVHKDYGNGSA